MLVPYRTRVTESITPDFLPGPYATGIWQRIASCGVEIVDCRLRALGFVFPGFHSIQLYVIIFERNRVDRIFMWNALRNYVSVTRKRALRNQRLDLFICECGGSQRSTDYTMAFNRSETDCIPAKILESNTYFQNACEKHNYRNPRGSKRKKSIRIPERRIRLQFKSLFFNVFNRCKLNSTHYNEQMRLERSSSEWLACACHSPQARFRLRTFHVEAPKNKAKGSRCPAA